MATRRRNNIITFWAKVKKTRTCWLWQGYKLKKGYGQYSINGHFVVAHRIAWQDIKKTPIPRDMVLDHVCRTRNCVNPKHLRVVTPRQNALENSLSISAINAKKTHCNKGHKFTSKNTIRKKDGGRACRACAKVFYLKRRLLFFKNKLSKLNVKRGTGAYYLKERKHWTSQITFMGRRMFLGSYKTREKACLAYTVKAKELLPKKRKLILREYQGIQKKLKEQI